MHKIGRGLPSVGNIRFGNLARVLNQVPLPFFFSFFVQHHLSKPTEFFHVINKSGRSNFIWCGSIKNYELCVIGKKKLSLRRLALYMKKVSSAPFDDLLSEIKTLSSSDITEHNGCHSGVSSMDRTEELSTPEKGEKERKGRQAKRATEDRKRKKEKEKEKPTMTDSPDPSDPADSCPRPWPPWSRRHRRSPRSRCPRSGSRPGADRGACFLVRGTSGGR